MLFINFYIINYFKSDKFNNDFCMVYSFFLKIIFVISFLLVLKLFRVLIFMIKGGVYGWCVFEVKLYWGICVYLYIFYIVVLLVCVLIVC